MSNYFNLKNIFVILIWISIWLSIGINPDYIFKFQYNFQNLFNSDFIKLLRILVPIILSLMWILFILKNKRFLKIAFSINLTSIFLILYFLTQLFSLMLSNNYFINFYWIYFPFIMLTLVNFILIDNDEKICFQLNLISMIILFIVFLKFIYPLFLNFFSSSLSFYNMWPTVYAYDFTVPRPTGLARTALLLIAFLLCFNFNNIIYKIVRYPLIIFFGLNICLFQSRTILFLWPVIIFLILFFKNQSLKNKIKELALILILPIILFYGMNLSKISYNYLIAYKVFKSQNVENKETSIFNFKEYKEFIEKPKNSDKYEVQVYRDTDPKSFSSFRTLHWKKIFLKIKENNFIGYGPMGDRYIINNTASSIIFYSLSSGGIYGLITIILLCLRSLYLISFFILKKKCFSRDNYELINFSCLILVILFLRGVLETSIGIFSIDYCMYILPALFVEYKYNLLKEKLDQF